MRNNSFARSSPWRSTSAACRSSSQRRIASTRRASSALTSGVPAISPGFVRMRIRIRPSAAADRSTSKSEDTPLNASVRIFWKRSRSSVLIALARHEDEAGHEAPVHVLAHQQAQPLALAELQDRHRVALQVVGADLQQLVARIGLEDRGERLAAVARGQERGALHDRGELAPQQRHLARVRRVGSVGVEAEEARLAAHLALGVEVLDADVVEMAGPVHGRARVRLGEQQDLLHPRALARIGGKRGEARRHRLARTLAQDAETAAGNDAQHVFAAGGGDLVVAAAEEGEIGLAGAIRGTRDLPRARPAPRRCGLQRARQ